MQIPLSEAYEHAASIAASSERLLDLKRDGELVYADLAVKHASEWLDLDRAHDVLRLHVLAGRYEEADVLASDIKAALTDEIARLITNGSIEVVREAEVEEPPAPPEPRPVWHGWNWGSTQ